MLDFVKLFFQSLHTLSPALRYCFIGLFLTTAVLFAFTFQDWLKRRKESKDADFWAHLPVGMTMIQTLLWGLWGAACLYFVYGQEPLRTAQAPQSGASAPARPGRGARSPVAAAALTPDPVAAPPEPPSAPAAPSIPAPAASRAPTAPRAPGSQQSPSVEVAPPAFPPGRPWNVRRPGLRWTDLKGKVVLVHFFNCLNEGTMKRVPELLRLLASNRDLAIIGWHVGAGTAGEIGQTLSQHHITYPVVASPMGNDPYQAWGLKPGVPQATVVDRAGGVRFTRISLHEGERLAVDLLKQR